MHIHASHLTYNTKDLWNRSSIFSFEFKFPINIIFLKKNIMNKLKTKNGRKNS